VTIGTTTPAAFGYGFLAAGCAVLALLAGSAISGRPGSLEVVADGVTRFVPLPVFESVLLAIGPLAKGLLFSAVVVIALLGGGALAVVLRGLARAWRAGGLLLGATAAAAVLEGAVTWIASGSPYALGTAYEPVALGIPAIAACIAYAVALTAMLPTAADGATELSMLDDAASGPAGEPVGRVGLTRRTLLARGAAIVGGIALAGDAGVTVSRVLDAARAPGARSAIRPQAPAGANTSAASTPAGVAIPGTGVTDPTAAATAQATGVTGVTGFGPTPALTPVSDFYVVLKDISPPSVDGTAWRLVIDGLVDRPHSLDLAELRALPSRTGYRTLECVSYTITIPNDLISNQLWKGVAVADLLDAAAVRPAAGWVWWTAADGYTESLPLAVARDPGTWIAYEMAGAPLTVDHGYPARVLVAGRFGMKQPKWVTRLTVADRDRPGFWEQNGWGEQAIVRVMSRIDTPAWGATLRAGVPFAVTGIAFAGDRGISRVEVSADDGATWKDAILEDATRAPLGPLTWVRWRAVLVVNPPRRATLAVRATDGRGTVQSGVYADAPPDGSAGWDRVGITFAG
jgi:DMSO/TMAO reductase YedYZ molybdopterin-dependent catalytic subunit